MIDYENTRTTVSKGLKSYLGRPVIRANQNAEPPPYPFLSYNITRLMSENRGTYGKYSDGYARKPVTMTMSITAQSDDNLESVVLANKAREWLDYAGADYLEDNGVIVQSVGAVTNRDNVLTVEYEYKNGFDVVFWLFDEIKDPDSIDTIETMIFGEDLGKRLESRLDGVVHNEYGISQTQEDVSEALNETLADRLSGVE